jgi:hypothetical protein
MPKMKIKIAIMEKINSLKGFPDNQANNATETNGKHNRTPNNLFEGCHFAINPINRK